MTLMFIYIYIYNNSRMKLNMLYWFLLSRGLKITVDKLAYPFFCYEVIDKYVFVYFF